VHSAAVRPEESRYYRDRGCLAGAIGAEQSKDLPRVDGERDPINCDNVAVTLDEAFDL